MPNSNEIYIIANPGEGLTELAFTNPNVNLPKPVRDYDSVEFAFEKRMRDNCNALRTSYLWSRLYGNYSGLSQSDENGRTSPNVGRLWDYPLMMFQDGGTAALGPLATDRPHQFKAQFIYQFDMGTSFGLNEYIASGLPISREIGIYPGNNLPVNYLGRLSDGRTPMCSQTDLFVQHAFTMGGRSLQISFNVLNLLNQDDGWPLLDLPAGQQLGHAGRGCLLQRPPDAGVADPGPGREGSRFLMDNAFQAPIAARFGIKFLF